MKLVPDEVYRGKALIRYIGTNIHYLGLPDSIQVFKDAEYFSDLELPHFHLEDTIRSSYLNDVICVVSLRSKEVYFQRTNQEGNIWISDPKNIVNDLRVTWDNDSIFVTGTLVITNGIGLNDVRLEKYAFTYIFDAPNESKGYMKKKIERYK